MLAQNPTVQTPIDLAFPTLRSAFAVYMCRSALSSSSSRVLPSDHSETPMLKLNSRPARCPARFHSRRLDLILSTTLSASADDVSAKMTTAYFINRFGLRSGTYG